MPDPVAKSRIEPAVEAIPSTDVPALVPVAPPASSTPASPSPSLRGDLEQLARVEEKTARIEEKFARAEALMLRLESKIESATDRTEAAAHHMSGEVAVLSRRLRALPGYGSLALTAIVSAILAAVLTVAVLRFGLPGVLPQ